MSKHTPGPWTVEHHGGSYHIFGADDARVGTYGSVHPHQKEAPDNARLIAATPELLEALSEVKEWIGNWDPNFTHDDEWPATAQKIRAAIAKATGAGGGR